MAIATPKTTPSATRRNEMASALGSSPSSIRSQPLEAIAVGAPTVDFGKAPVRLSTSHRSRSATGLIHRAQRGGV